MTERLQRLEYQPLPKRQLSREVQNALTRVENILTSGTDTMTSRVTSTYRDGVSTTKLDAYLLDSTPEAQLAYWISDDGSLSWEVSTDTSVGIEMAVSHMVSGHIETTAELTLSEYLAGSPHPFLTRYTLELFRNGYAQTLHEQNAVWLESGLDARAMTQYDFRLFHRHLGQVSLLRDPRAVHHEMRYEKEV